MARARNIKPSLFKNELLGVADPLLTILFTGLWCLSDRDGLIEDRPLRIKAEIFPYRENLDVNGYLTELSRLGFIRRYNVGEIKVIHILKFLEHQNPHHTEKKSELPKYDINQEDVQAPLNNGYETVNVVLIPDSLILIPDSGIPPTDPLNGTVAKKEKITKSHSQVASDIAIQESCREIWNHYKNAYYQRYNTEPVRNAKVNKNVKDLFSRLGQEAKHVAAYYVSINDSFLIKRSHDFGSLLAGAESYRTQWATGQQMTTAKANQVDRTQTNADAVNGAIELIKARHAAKEQSNGI